MLNVSIIKPSQCPNCGAPLAPPKTHGVIVCSFCQAEFHKEGFPQFCVPLPLPVSHPTPDLGRISLGNHGYRVHGRLARGSHCDVFLARRDAALTEMVIVKVAREFEEQHVMQEWKTLAQLHQRAAGGFLQALLPQPVAIGVARCPGKAERPASVYRWRSGFQFTIEDARSQYPAGVEGRACVWMWNRLLDQLGCLHQLGYAHGAVTPAHLLLHPRDHGLVLCGWSRCAPGPTREDISQSAHCIAYLLGSEVPLQLTQLVQRAGKMTDALELKAELKRVAQEVYGPPRFHAFVL